ncbi:MAG TPA: hypothetical protein VFJ20_16555 [Gemmatimonadaceae bacterium]|nr:hypothetical protein [Gemmatimonadaceae bacterium]
MRNPILPAVAAITFVLTTADAQRPPSNGQDVLQRMHDAYVGKWYTTLTFRQQTTQWRPDGSQAVSAWLESLRYTPAIGTQLRIDIGDLAAGNGVLYTADSTFVVRAGKLTTTRPQGNEFLPLIEGVYMQPVERTMRELHGTGIDFTKVTEGRWDDRSVWIVGASSPADSASPQFWVDVERKVVVRMILVPAPNTPTMDIHLERYEPLAGGWLATKIEMYVAGKPRQFEEYSDWRAGMELPAALFDVQSWTQAPHWGKQPTPEE